MTILRISGWIVAIVLAGFVGLWTFAVGQEVRAPKPIPAFGYALSGSAAANAAYASFAAREEKKAGTEVTSTERALAERAYRREPMSVAALALLAKSRNGAGESRALLDLAGQLSRRNFLTSSELIKSSAQQDEPRLFFTWLSRVMLTNDTARKGYSLAMADATARNDAVAALVPVLSTRPGWSEDYWESVVTRPNSLVNAAKLRMELARQPWRQVEMSKADSKMIVELVKNRHFDTAEQLAGTLGLRTKRGELVRNGDFASSPSFSPFDWELVTLGNLGASINDDDKYLSISAIGGAKGLAAQQLLRLAPGEYRLNWSLSGDLPADGMPLSIRIACAEAGIQAMTPLSIPLEIGKKGRDITISGAACRWYWLSIFTDVADDAPGLDAAIDNLSIISGGAESRTR